MTNRQQKALVALIRAPTIEAAAETAGVGYSTLRRWMREDAEFKAAYRAALDELLQDASAQAKQSLSPALKALGEIVEDEGQPATARISAARSILEYGLKLTETVDILARLDALEGSLGGEDHA